MGRANNSFTNWAGRASEINEDRVTLPEKDLWVAVLHRAALDACKGPPRLDLTSRANISHHNYYKYNREAARHFFLRGGAHFKEICEMAGRNPEYVKQKIRQIILRKNGWNVDVPLTSHYRKSEGLNGKRKRGRPKKLTGNSYYAAIGKKGGRPRIYNDV